MMEAYNDTKCEHFQLAARCPLCMAKAGRMPQVAAPPTSITGGPPPDIEECTPSLRSKVDGPAPADLIPEWEKPLPPGVNGVNDLGNTRAAQKQMDTISADVEYHVPSVPATLPAHCGQVLRVVPGAIFDTLPTDDSHASKVVRAAAEYAKLSNNWALQLSGVEKIKSELLIAQATLDKTTMEKNKAEAELKSLVNGESNG